MGPLAIVLIGGTIYYIYEKQKNPAWSPFTRLLSTPVDKVVALEKVKVTSVPTPSPTVALDPHMTTDQVKQVNQTLTSETDPKKIAAHAIALGAVGHGNSAMALAAKANAVGEAKATGASDVDIHGKQIEAASATPFEHVPVPVDAPMTACEAQVLLNVLTSRQGHFDVEGVPVPLAVTNAFDADTSHLIRVFQAELHLLPTGTLDAETAKALRIQALSPAAPYAGPVAAGWGPVAAGSSGSVATGFHGRGRFHPRGRGFGGWSYYPAAEGYYGWTQPWQHNHHPWYHHHSWAGWPWHGFVGQRGREEYGRGRDQFGRGREHPSGYHETRQFGRGREQFGRGREHPSGYHEARQFGRGREMFMPQFQQYGQQPQFQQYGQQPQYMEEEFGEEMPMHHRHRHHLTREQIFELQERERERLHHHHRRHPHHEMMQHQVQVQQQVQPQQEEYEAAAPAGMPIGGGGGAAAMAAPLTVEADHAADTTATQGWWFPDVQTYDPYSNSGFGGYGSIGWGGPGGLGGYGSWGSFGGWGHGL